MNYSFVFINHTRYKNQFAAISNGIVRTSLMVICFLTTFLLNAQFDRVKVNQGNIHTKTVIKAAGDNDFVTIIDGELFHVTYNGFQEFNVDWIENSIVNIYDFVMHDIDRDGDLDIICYQNQYGGFHVYLKENGRYSYYPSWNISNNKPHFLHSQDFDGDGFEDLMINHGVYRNTGVNERERVFNYTLGNAYYYKNAHFMDFDGDGDMDIQFYQIHRLWVLINDGESSSHNTLNIDETTNSTAWNRVIKTSDGEKVIYYNRATMTINEVVFDGSDYTIVELAEATIDPNYSEAIVYDINGDGNEEIIVNSYNYRDVFVFRYDPASGQDQLTSFEVENTTPSTALEMFEIDGEPRLFLANRETYRAYSFNDELEAVLDFTSTTGISGSGSGFKDFDGDGNVDVISGTATKPYLGDGEFAGVVGFSYPSTGGDLEDYDLDGDLDYVKTNEWFENIGNYTFGPSIEITFNDPTPDPEIFFTSELYRADIDKDGDIDVLLYNNFGEPLELLENIDNDHFADAVTIATSDHIGGDVVYINVLDMDGDDVNDIVMSAHFGLILLKGTGGVTFGEPISLYDGNDKPLSVDLDDINSDGFPDLVLGTRNIIAGSSLGEVILYLGSNDIPTSSVVSYNQGYHRAAFGNINQTGWLDIIYQNAKGLFWAETSNGSTFESTMIDIHRIDNSLFNIVDVNSDGDDDIILYYQGDPEIYYYLNNDDLNQGNDCPSGDVYCRDQSQLTNYFERYATCPVINGNLFIGRADNSWSDITNISMFDHVTEITGTLNLHLNNSLSDLTGLDALERIGGSFMIRGHKSSSFHGIEKLRSIGGDLSFNNVATIGSNAANLEEFESLDTIGGNLSLLQSNISSISSLIQPKFNGDVKLDRVFTYSDGAELEQIDTVLGVLLINGTSLSSIKLTGLRYAHSVNITSNEYLESINFGSPLKVIDGDLQISYNNYLQLIEGLDSLERIGGSLYAYVGNCKTFKSLKTIGGGLSLISQQWGDLAFSKLDSIGEDLSILTYTGDDLHQFSNLHYLGGGLNITNNKITSLNGLQNIKGQLDRIDIINNHSLQHLNDLHDSLSTDGEWRLFNNEKLSYCNVVPLCNHISKGGDFRIYNNGIDCSDISKIRCLNNTFSGFVFHDFNENGKMEITEAPLSNIHIDISTQQSTFITSDNGYYITNAMAGDTFNVKVQVPNDWTAVGSDEIQLDSFISGADNNYGNNFGLVPNFDKHDISFSSHQSLFLCSRPYLVDIDVVNNGTYLEEGVVDLIYPEHVELDPDFTNYLSHDVVNRVIRLSLDTLYPFFSTHFTIPLIAPSADFIDEEFITIINLSRLVTPDLELVFTQNETHTLLCSFDPNDKIVKGHKGTTDFEYDSDEALIYTIRFQNTGNYYADNVRITDTISAYLDMSTFQFISASHPLEISMLDNVIYFNFNDIMLPDSTLDYTGSQGYVTFRIKPISNAAIGIEIDNEADIYFDYNDAIYTNLVRSEIVETVSTSQPVIKQDYSISPNPTSGTVTVFNDQLPLDGQLTYRIYSIDGKLLDAGVAKSNSVDFSGLGSGVYVLRVGVDGVFKVVKF